MIMRVVSTEGTSTNLTMIGRLIKSITARRPFAKEDSLVKKRAEN